MAEVRKPTPLVPLDTKLAEETYPAKALPVHERFGQGIRFRMGKTVCDIYPAPPVPNLGSVAVVRGRRNRLDIADLKSITPMLHDEKGLLLTSPEDTVWIKPDGRYYHEYTPRTDASLPQDTKTTEQTVLARRTTTEEPEPKTEMHRVGLTGFFGKVLEGFPRQTEDERTMYKLLVGNFSEEKKQDGTEKIDWTTVTALEPHVVRFLEEHVDTFEKRKTHLLVEGYYQDVEKKLRRSTKIVRELYALSIKQQP